MLLKDIFQKSVERAIEGVIKADDEASLRLEVEEYVITQEVEKQLEEFLYAYNNYQGANAGWISGFFGSGKSHLLKMLALVLENRIIEATPVADIFLPKCDDNKILYADLQKATRTPSKSILFNIDQKADVINKTEVDALLSVFIKVFDEMQGYFGKQAHVAQFERDLDSRNLYQPFMQAYEQISGKSWLRGREQSVLEKKNIAKAYASITDGDENAATHILDEYRKDLRISIEDFADKVSAYIKKQEPNFRLNFFVDEVGQYIADNIKLMTNLQTIAESLATKCRGSAWIIVTAQEDMDSVIGEMNKKQANDFTKIQDRFKNRIKLTSANVAEVIQKRLLTKNAQSIEALSQIYHAEQANFKTLFTFDSDGARQYKVFIDNEHFVRSYPFIPYQFDLFQSAIKSLSVHNAFEGKHRSVGERSMLGVFQQVAIHIGKFNIHQLATFDLMFAGIRSSLKSEIQHSILQAENHLNNDFAIRVLKALFLVKYVREFKPSLNNLAVLMLPSFQQDIKKLRAQIEEALELLEQQSYIARHGDIYEYLTVEEKDIEEEIKNMDIAAGEVASELEQLIFSDVIKEKKFRYDNGQDFAFARKLDDALHGREHELAIHVVTPFHPSSSDENVVCAQSLGRNELLVILPQDALLYRDLILYKKTEKYVRLNTSASQKETVRRILEGKGDQSRERRNKLKERMELLISTAKIFVSGTVIEVNGTDAHNRIKNGFHQLIVKTYINLPMLRGKHYVEKDILTYLTEDKGEMAPLSEAEQDMLNTIQNNARSGVRTSVKSLLETFERRPYGWSLAAILCILAKLCAREKLEVRLDSNILVGRDLARALVSTQAQPNLLLQAQVEFTTAQQRALRDFYIEFFDVSPQRNDARHLAEDTKNALKEIVHSLEALLHDTKKYPFLCHMQPVITQLKEVQSKPYAWFLQEFTKEKEILLDAKENIIDPIAFFMEGTQKQIFDKAHSFFVENESNFAYIKVDEVQELRDILASSSCPKGAIIQHLKSLHDTLQVQVNSWLESEKLNAKGLIGDLRDNLYLQDEFKLLDAEQRNTLTQRFTDSMAEIDKQRLIAVIQNTAARFKHDDYVRITQQMIQWTQPQDNLNVTEYIPLSSVKVQHDKGWLMDAEDVDQYVESLRKALLEAVKQGKRVHI